MDLARPTDCGPGLGCLPHVMVVVPLMGPLKPRCPTNPLPCRPLSIHQLGSVDSAAASSCSYRSPSSPSPSPHHTHLKPCSRPSPLVLSAGNLSRQSPCVLRPQCPRQLSGASNGCVNLVHLRDIMDQDTCRTMLSA